jgi:hypothetical protein
MLSLENICHEWPKTQGSGARQRVRMMLMGKASGPSWRIASSELGEGETEREIDSGTHGFQYFALRR